jgi:pimeloyl-ACP methyl ester carboxylesterase
MSVPQIVERSLTTADGTRLAYQVREAETADAPTIVLANGLGGTYTAWRHQYALFGRRFKVISWDYRGLFRSSRPADLATLAIARQVADLRDVLDVEQVDRALLVGWSMGVQFNFEFRRQFPERTLGLVVCSGTAGRPFDGVMVLPQLQKLLPCVLGTARHASPLIGPITSVVTRWSGLIPLMQKLGMVAPSLDRSVFDDIASEFGGLDFEAYIETLRYLGEHDCTDSLGEIDVPTLVICGTKDMLTPVDVAEGLVQRIPDSELVLIEGGTHYVAVEFPEQVNAHLERFLSRLFG